MLAHEKKRFAERVDYLTSPGYLDGGDARARYPFRGGGPSAIVTTLGILRPDLETREFVLAARYAFASVEEIVANIGWPLRVSEPVAVVPEPTERELAALRQVDQTGMLRRNANE
jgi:glutaconate CoA-transferase subunit B